jgi:hypothetical protein
MNDSNGQEWSKVEDLRDRLDLVMYRDLLDSKMLIVNH